MYNLVFLAMFTGTIMMDKCDTNPPAKQSLSPESALKYLVREPLSLKEHAPLLILLHGYGSNEKDLFSFADSVPENWLVVSVRAPIDLGGNKYKWYDVKMANEKITMNFQDEEQSRTQLLQLITELKQKYKVDNDKVVTAGFSQGANMALALALTAPSKVLGAGCFSGRFMEEITPLVTSKKALQAKPIFISHGTEDTMLPLSYADENQKILEGWGMTITRSIDEVAHTISSKQLTDFVMWLQAL